MPKNITARLEISLINNPLLRKSVQDFVSGNMGGEFLKGGLLDTIRAECLSDVSGDTVFIFGAGIGNDLSALSKNKIKQIVGIDITDKYQAVFLKKAKELNLAATLEVGNILDPAFVQELISKYGQPQSIIIVFTLCCIRRPFQALQIMEEVLSKDGHIFIIEHVADTDDKDMYTLQNEVRDAWMKATGGLENGGCDVTLDMNTIIRRTSLLVEDAKIYRDDRLKLHLAAFQWPVVYVKARK